MFDVQREPGLYGNLGVHCWINYVDGEVVIVFNNIGEFVLNAFDGVAVFAQVCEVDFT